MILITQEPKHQLKRRHLHDAEPVTSLSELLGGEGRKMVITEPVCQNKSK